MQKKATAAATSSGVPMRRIGVLARIWLNSVGLFNIGRASGVSIYHGATAFTLMPLLAHSMARFFVI